MTRVLWIDGEPAGARDLARQALVNYGAYTSFRVEDGAVRGLDRHLTRLDASAVELFGDPVGEARLRDLTRQALDGRPDAWLRVSLFSSDISHRDVEWRGVPRVMVGVFDPPAPLPGGLRIQPQTHLRHAPHLKHAGTFDLVRARRAARADGFDDAVFVHPDGRLLEGTLWSLGFVQGETIVWPQGPKLAGVTQALIDDGLASVGLTSETRPVRIADLPGMDAAFLCNSATPAAAIAAIGDHVFADNLALIDRLATAWRAAPPQLV